jgi:uncharacterized protein YdhG (YjbR/CyaY superfamily)
MKTKAKTIDVYVATLIHDQCSAVESQKDELESCKKSKRTIRFQSEKHLPVSHVSKVVKYLLTENAAHQCHTTDGR